MTSTTRDIHSPANVRPEDYEFEGVFYQGASEDIAEAYEVENEIFDANYAAQGDERYEGNYALKATCDHCGARFAYGAYYRHEPTAHVIVTGHICADETFSLPDRVTVIKRNKARKAEAIKRRRLALEALEPETRAAIEYLNDGGLQRIRSEGYRSLLIDIAGKAVNQPLTERQQAVLVKAHNSLVEEENAPESEDEDEARIDAPEGKVEFEGVVVYTKWKEGAYGAYKSTIVRVDTEDGAFKVWMRAPKALTEVESGDRAKLRATLTRSDDDHSFAFARRPFVIEYHPQEAA